MGFWQQYMNEYTLHTLNLRVTKHWQYIKESPLNIRVKHEYEESTEILWLYS